MLLRIILFAVIGLGSAGFGIIGWVGLHSSVATSPAEAAIAPVVKTISVLVAGSQLTAGTLIKPDSLISAEVNKDSLKPGFWADTPAARGMLVGAMIRRSMAVNEVVMPADVMMPGDHGFLAAVLGSDERAVSVGVDAVSGAAGLIWPGDHVDVILTQQIDDTTAPAGRRVAGETVLHAARVIAIDQQLIHGDASPLSSGSANRTVTLEVSPTEAERISVAMRIGKLSLVVVAADQVATAQESGKAPPRTITWGGDVSSALGQKSPTDVSTIHLYLGTTDSKEIHF